MQPLYQQLTRHSTMTLHHHKLALPEQYGIAAMVEFEPTPPKSWRSYHIAQEVSDCIDGVF